MSGFVKREYDCGHYTVAPGHYESTEECPVCFSGQLVDEIEATEDDYREADLI